MNDRWPMFNIKRDIAIINAGGFFCKACASGKPPNEQSPDPRYCKECYEFLMKEASFLPAGKRPAWIPKDSNVKSTTKKQYQRVQDVSPILSTSNSKKITVDKIRSVTPISNRGRKKQNLPIEIIKELASQGMGCKAIAARLLSDYGLVANYRTIARRLQDLQF